MNQPVIPVGYYALFDIFVGWNDDELHCRRVPKNWRLILARSDEELIYIEPHAELLWRWDFI